MGTNGAKVIGWRQRTKDAAIIYKGGKCVVCAYKRCVWALQFHHLDPKEKDFQISGICRSWESIKIELDKCVLLCAICHAEVHAGILDLATALKSNPSPQEGDALIVDANLQRNVRHTPKFCDCGKSIEWNSTRCLSCAGYARGTKIAWPQPIDLILEVSFSSKSAVARRLGVSEAAVRKRLLS